MLTTQTLPPWEKNTTKTHMQKLISELWNKPRTTRHPAYKSRPAVNRNYSLFGSGRGACVMCACLCFCADGGGGQRLEKYEIIHIPDSLFLLVPFTVALQQNCCETHQVTAENHRTQPHSAKSRKVQSSMGCQAAGCTKRMPLSRWCA